MLGDTEMVKWSVLGAQVEDLINVVVVSLWWLLWHVKVTLWFFGFLFLAGYHTSMQGNGFLIHPHTAA